MNTPLKRVNNVVDLGGVKDGPLYIAQEKVYPREVQGRFNNLRVAAVIVLLGLFYILPWVNWDHRQAVLFDLPARKFYIFGLTFFPQDFFLLSWLLLIAALSLFFFTAVAGRLWCGFACPQTVWTEIFVWMERWTEGNRQQRMKLDKAPWSAEKIARKSAKQFLWVTFALHTGFTFVGFFTPIREIAVTIPTFSLGPWETFWSLFYGFATYGNAGYMREQVCKYMCPYARFQSAMVDKQTLVITYDQARGDPRGSRSRGKDPKALGLGDCIDCKLCVQACPTGIDIRNGLQIDCIGCAACIDACDSVMDKMQYPRGLVRYTTQAALEGTPTRVIRPRTVIYATLLLALIGGFIFAVLNRELVVVDVMRDRNALYRPLDDGRIENVYTVRLVNKDTSTREFKLDVVGLDRYTMDYDPDVVRVTGGAVVTVVTRIQVPAGAVSGGRDIKIVAMQTDGSDLFDSDARFIAPVAP